MIRVRKGPEPEELAVSGYSADAVKAQLIADQDGKCYLCEREVGGSGGLTLVIRSE